MVNVIKQLSSAHAKMNKALATAAVHSEKIAGLLSTDGFKATPKSASPTANSSNKKNKDKTKNKTAKAGRKSRKSEG